MNPLVESRWAAFGLLVFMATAGCHYDDTITYAEPVWCGEQPCFWTVDEGTVGRGPTWHAQDPALELVSERVRLSRVFIPEGDIRCTGISLLGDGAHEDVFFDIDVGDDGTVEHSLVVVADRFERVVLEVDAEAFRPPRPVRFILRKEGPFRPLLADIRLRCGPLAEFRSDPQM